MEAIRDLQGMEHLRDRFIDWMAVRQFAESTRLNRCRQIDDFIAWCAQRSVLRPAEVTRPMLERYQRHLHHYRKKNGKPLAIRSQCGYTESLRAWFRWLTRESYLPFNPASDLVMPRPEKRLPRFLSPAEAEQVLALPDLSSPIGLRDRAMLEALYSTGLRRCELLRLIPSDIDFDRGLVLVRLGKGKKDRLIPIGARALAWIERYMLEARPKLETDVSEEIFLTDRGRPVHPSKLTQMTHRYIKASGVGKSGSCHLLRHTMATAMMENGADIRMVQAMLGHEQLNTTAIYTHVAVSKLKATHDATHPAKMERPKSIE